MPAESPRARAFVVWSISFVALALATGAMFLWRPQLDKAHFALVYLLIVLGGSAAGGRALGLTLAGLAFVAFDYLFLPPYYTLVIANPIDWLVLIAFLATSVVAAQLLARAQDRAAEARARTDEVERLAALGAETLNAGRADEALSAIAEVIRGALGVERCDLYSRDPASPSIRLAASAGAAPTTLTSSLVGATSVLSWVASEGAPAIERLDGTMRVAPGLLDAGDDDAWPATDDARALAIPLRIRAETVGVLRVESRAGIALAAAQRQFLAALGYYAALGVERLRLTAEAEHAAALRETGRLQRALLASVSHDLRTPLTTITALAHTVREEGAAAGDPRLRSIAEEAERLARVVGDLLEFSKLAGGAMRMRPELNTADELVGAVAQRVRGVLRGRELRITMPASEVPLVGRFDLVHALRALGNLVENALKYSAPPAPIELSVVHDGGALLFEVADRGAGVPAGEGERIFEAFYRPPGVPADVGGSGLGLTIARGLAEAQGGAVRYRPRTGGGSVFELRLPAEDAPAP